MPRGKQRSIEDRLADVDQEISELKERKSKIDEKISELNKQRESILDEQKMQKLGELSDFLSANNLTPEQLMSMVKTNQDSE